MAVTAAEVAVLDATETPAPSKRRLRFLRGRKTVVGLGILLFFVVIAVIGPWIAPYDPDTMSNELLQPPSGAHWFGTTQTGQDVLSQILVGTRGVLVVGFVAGIFATILSVLIGVSAGFLGGTADELLSVLSNVFLVIPGLPLIIIIASLRLRHGRPPDRHRHRPHLVGLGRARPARPDAVAAPQGLRRSGPRHR